jgi:hypothetical protein
LNLSNKNGTEIKYDEGEWKSLAEDIAKEYGAADLLYNPDVTTPITKDKELESGNLIGIQWNKGKNGYHNITVTNKPENDKLKYIQGSHNGGVPVEVHENEVEMDTNTKNIKVDAYKVDKREWNFEKFDNH